MSKRKDEQARRAAEKAAREAAGIVWWRDAATHKRLRAEPGPGARFPCDHPLVREGRVIPGRGGGRATACATPLPRWEPKDKLSLWLGDALLGGPFRLSTARDRLRGKSLGRDSRGERESRKEATILAVSDYRRGGLPQPIGRLNPGPRGSSRCDAEHPVWAGYREAISEASADAAERVGDGASDREYERAVKASLAALYPAEFSAWDALARECVARYEARIPQARGYESPQAEVARRRRAAELAGIDVTSSEWTDTLAGEGKGTERARKRRAASSRKATAPKRKRAA